MWKETLKYLVEELKDKDNVEGILLVGDKAIGYKDDKEDIEVLVLVKNKSDYESPLIKIIDDYRFIINIYEYEQIKEKFEIDYKKYKQTTAIKLLTGKVLYDGYGNIATLKDIALTYKNKLFPSIKNVDEIKKYIDIIGSNLIKKVDDEDFDFKYFLALNKIFEYYFRYLGLAYYPVKTFRFCADNEYAKEYLYPEIEDKIFSNFVVKAIQAKTKDEKLTVIDNLIKHIKIEMK